MTLAIELNDLVAYTDWQREKWHAFFLQHPETLKNPSGPHGDGRFNTIGDLVKHIFSAEKRYIDRLSNRSLTDPASVPNNDVEALFRFAKQSRRELREFIDALPAMAWDVPAEHSIVGNRLRLTPRKIVVHVVLHEIRHWAQIATLTRLNGSNTELQDFLLSPVGGDPRI